MGGPSMDGVCIWGAWVEGTDRMEGGETALAYG